MVAEEEDALLIKNAEVPGYHEPVDVLAEDGLITEVGSIDGEGLDVGGRMLCPAFVNIHTHLDKADLLSRMAPGDFGKSLEENRRLLRKFKRDYSGDEIIKRAGGVAYEMIRNGVAAIRSQVDVDETGGLTPLNALVELRGQLPLRLQICAFPQQGLIDEKSARLVEQSLTEGADVLGGLPLVEKGPELQLQHLDILFELAKKYDVDLEVQIDESNNPQDFLLPALAEKTIENGWVGRVSATHCISLSAQVVPEGQTERHRHPERQPHHRVQDAG
jgi:cytosine deaminase